MKKIIIPLLSIIHSINVLAQSASESKESSNSILLNGSAITLKITDPTLKLDFQSNKLFKNSSNNGYLVGISAAGKNNSGLAPIFNGGDLVPSGKITAIGGFTFSNNLSASYGVLRESYRSREERLRNRLEELYDIRDKMQAQGRDLTEIDKTISSATDELTALLQEAATAATAHSKTSFWKLSLFGYGGIHAKSFKRYIGYDSVNLIKSFKNENFRGGYWVIGANYQYRNLVFGATLGRTSDDNQSQLSEQTYNWERTKTVGDQTIKESNEIKAYSGSYGTLHYNSFNADVILNIALDKVSSVEQPRNFMYINPYIHAQFNSSNVDLLPNTTDVGLGLYLFNNKSMLVGGVYVELPDINDNIEKGKAVADRSIRPALQKLSFGIVTRLNIQSFMRFQNQ